MTQYTIAIVGATGLVGRTFLEVMGRLNTPVASLRLFASSRSLGTTIHFQGKQYLVELLQPGCFVGVDYALFSAGASVSKEYALQATAEGAIVIDNSSAWRMDSKVPLVVPEINMFDAVNKTLIANPNCSTIQCVLPLAVLSKLYGLAQVEYNTYQAVSGSGQKGLNDLSRTQSGKQPTFYPYDISATAIPQVDVFEADGYTKEEHKMMNETRKILHLPTLPISATCVRVPVAHSHGVSIRVTLQKQADLDDIRNALSNQIGITVVDDPELGLYPTSIQATGAFDILVGRIRRDTIDPNAILLYVVADNILKGAALNAVQIMMEMMNHE